MLLKAIYYFVSAPDKGTVYFWEICKCFHVANDFIFAPQSRPLIGADVIAAEYAD
jgi:hypothetical protein